MYGIFRHRPRIVPSRRHHIHYLTPTVNPVIAPITSLSVHYGFYIDVSDSINISHEKEIGLFNDPTLGGCAFRWVTGRPDYDGSTITPTGELPTASAVSWAEGMITAPGDIGSPVRMIDINTAGDYGTLSGMGVKVNNIAVEQGNFAGKMLFDILEDNSIYIVNRKARFYVIINDVFYNVWSGVVSKIIYDEKTFSIQCEDDFKNLHKPIPPEIANEKLFPNITKKSIGKPIPVSFGLLNHARLLNIERANDPIDLSIGTDGVKRKIGLINNITENLDSDGNPTNTTLFIYVGARNVVINEFLGYFLRLVLDDGTNTFYKITSNSAPFILSGESINQITVNLNGIIESDDLTVFDPSDPERSTWAEIFNFESTYIVSNDEVTELPLSDHGHLTDLEYYDTSTGEYINVSEASDKKSLTDIMQSGFPGLTAFTNLKGNDGIYLKEIIFKPKNLILQAVNQSSGATVISDFPAIGETITNSLDKSQ